MTSSADISQDTATRRGLALPHHSPCARSTIDGVTDGRVFKGWELEPRSAAASGRDFPYQHPTTCYVEVWADGSVTHGTDAGTYERAKAGKSRLFAVWPGQYRSDLFVIDDLDEYAKALGLIHDQERTGLAEHEHDVRWTRRTYSTDNPRSPYVPVEVELGCGCTIRDLSVFAKHMREQRGWDVATSGGWGSSGASGGKQTYSLRVRRKSLAE